MDPQSALGWALARYAQLGIGDPDSDVLNDIDALYRKSSDFRAYSDARGDFASGLSRPEGPFTTLVDGRAAYWLQRKQPTASNFGFGGSADLNYDGILDAGTSGDISVVGVPVSTLQANALAAIQSTLRLPAPPPIPDGGALVTAVDRQPMAARSLGAGASPVFSSLLAPRAATSSGAGVAGVLSSPLVLLAGAGLALFFFIKD